MYDFPDQQIFIDGWDELGSFMKDVEKGREIVTKAEEVRWNGTKDPIPEDQFIMISPDQVIPFPHVALTKSYVTKLSDP
jgi:hypothetical protein